MYVLCPICTYSVNISLPSTIEGTESGYARCTNCESKIFLSLCVTSIMCPESARFLVGMKNLIDVKDK